MAGLDFNVCYRVAGYDGIAFRLLSYMQEWPEPECDGHVDDDAALLSGVGIGEAIYCDGSCAVVEPEENTDWVRAVMVGDDTIYTVEVTDLTPLEEGEFCAECGQVGCRAG